VQADDSFSLANNLPQQHGLSPQSTQLKLPTLVSVSTLCSEVLDSVSSSTFFEPSTTLSERRGFFADFDPLCDRMCVAKAVGCAKVLLQMSHVDVLRQVRF
jgi:hypothetical protein